MAQRSQRTVRFILTKQHWVKSADLNQKPGRKKSEKIDIIHANEASDSDEI